MSEVAEQLGYLRTTDREEAEGGRPALQAGNWPGVGGAGRGLDIFPATVTAVRDAEPLTTVEILEDQPPLHRLRDDAADASGEWSVGLTLIGRFPPHQSRAHDAAGNTGPRSPVRRFILDAKRGFVKKPSPVCARRTLCHRRWRSAAGRRTTKGSPSRSLARRGPDCYQTNVADCYGCVGVSVHFGGTPVPLDPGCTPSR